MPAPGLSALLPSAQALAQPALVACTIAVRDLAATENLLRNNAVPFLQLSSGDALVPGAAAFGAAIAFRQTSESCRRDGHDRTT